MTLMSDVRTHAPQHQTTKERCRIFHLGLDAHETLVIESLFRSHPELGVRYVFGPPCGDDCVDLMFVNADSPDMLANWQALRQKCPEVVAVMLTEDTSLFPGMKVLRKPLNFRNFVTILDVITSTGTTHGKAFATDAVRVLVVDDSFPARQFMKIKIEALAGEAALPLHIDMADSGEKALQLARLHAYDLAFLDVVMPGMDGYEACQQLKGIAPMRVVMLTGRVSATDFSRGKNAGCDNYLSKPAHDADLRTILHLTALRKMTQGKRPGH